LQVHATLAKFIVTIRHTTPRTMSLWKNDANEQLLLNGRLYNYNGVSQVHTDI